MDGLLNCNTTVFNKGRVLCILSSAYYDPETGEVTDDFHNEELRTLSTGCAQNIEDWVIELRKAAVYALIDWHYAAGRGVVKVIDPYNIFPGIVEDAGPPRGHYMEVTK